MEQLLSQLSQEAVLDDVVRPLKLQSLRAKHALVMYPHKALQLRIQCLDGSCIDVAIPRKCSFYQLRQLLQYQYVGDGGKRQISWRYIWKNFSIRSDTSDQFEVLFANCSNKIVTKFGVQTGMTLHFAPVDKWKSQRSKK